MTTENTSQRKTNSRFTNQSRHLFGLKQNAYQQVLNDDYEHRFPEDPFLEETGPNARVWRTYLAESSIFDENMIGEARDGLDAMLVFAGLFSAVVTSFLVQASENLQVDFTEVSANLLYELIAIQRAVADGVSPNAVPPSPLNPSTNFVPSTLDVWLNGLWAVSLSFSLVVALASVLIKQWLHHYMSFRSGTPGERSHIRQYRFAGFDSWQVLTIIGLLPIIMHGSLLMFLGGLILFWIPLDWVLSYIIGIITFVVYTLYLTSNILPIFHSQCPYKTPLTGFLLSLMTYFQTFLKVWMCSILGKVTNGLKGHPAVLLNDLETLAVNTGYNTLSVEALHWLYSMSSNTSVHSVVMQAIGGLPPDISVKQTVDKLFNLDGNCKDILEHLLTSCTSVDARTEPKCRNLNHPRAIGERLCRTMLFVSAQPPYLIVPPQNESRQGSVMVTLMAIGPSSSWLPEDYQTVIVDNHLERHHPFVWMSFINNALDCGAFQDVNKVGADLCQILLEAIWAPFQISPSDLAIGLNMATAIHFCGKSSVIQSYFLQTLAAFDLYQSLPLINRVMGAALELALDKMTDFTQRSENDHCWQLINYVFDCFESLIHDQQFCLEEFSQFIGGFIVRYIEKLLHAPNFSYSDPSFTAHWTYLASVFKTVPKLNYLYLRKFHIPLIRQISQYKNAREIQESIVASVIDILADVSDELRGGSVEAHRIFVHEQYLDFPFKNFGHVEYPQFLAPSSVTAKVMVGAFIVGLRQIKVSERGDYVDYLFHHQNLCLALIQLLFEEQELRNTGKHGHYEDVMSTLVQLCPTDRSLVAERDWLRVVLKWAIERDDSGIYMGYRWFDHQTAEFQGKLAALFDCLRTDSVVVNWIASGIRVTELQDIIQTLECVLDRKDAQLVVEVPAENINMVPSTHPRVPPGEDTPMQGNLTRLPTADASIPVLRWGQLQTAFRWRREKQETGVELQSVV